MDITRRQQVNSNEDLVRDLKAVKRHSSKLSNVGLGADVLLSMVRPRGTQVRRRCVVTGRGRGSLRLFRMSRIKVRDMALRGDLAYARKMTW